MIVLNSSTHAHEITSILSYQTSSFFRCEMHAIDYTVTAIETPPNSWLSINVYFVFYKINIPSTLSTRTFSQINKIITSNQTEKKTHPVELMFGWVWKW